MFEMSGIPLRKNFKGRKKPKRFLRNEPITSYGLILYSFKDEEPVFLLYQRRDNFEYTDFIRGVWSTDSQLLSMFSLMSEEERTRIRDYTFRELWDDMWVDHDSRVYRESYARSRKKYDAIRGTISTILKSTTPHSFDPPWGFPKGKKNGEENPVVCAKREFEEETHIPMKEITVYESCRFIEEFKGSNGKDYSTHYYLASVPVPVDSPLQITPGRIRRTTVSEEARLVRWFDYDDAYRIIHPRRGHILSQIKELIVRVTSASA